jgi:hypothetical protein
MPLKTSLVGVWCEGANPAQDLHVNALHLTDHSIITPVAGKVGTAGDFEADGSTYYTRASEALLQTGDVDFGVAAWVKAESLALGNPFVAAKRGTALAEEWRLDYGAGRFRFGVAQGGSVVVATANNLGAPALGTWYHLAGWYDSVAATVNIAVNNGGVDSTATGGIAPVAGAGQLTVGSADGVAGTWWDGLINQLVFRKSVWTGGDRSALYAGGAGLPFASWDLGAVGLIGPGLCGGSPLVSGGGLAR